MQHVYALVFAGVVTTLLAGGILYYEYGFWRTTYNRRDDIEIVDTKKNGMEAPSSTLSPGMMIGSFLKEAGERAKSIQVDTHSFMQGTIEYTKETDQASTTNTNTGKIEKR